MVRVLRPLVAVVLLLGATVAGEPPAAAHPPVTCDGHWHVAVGGGPDTSGLYGVTAPSPSVAWAVGVTYEGTQVHPLVERWDGASWTSVTVAGSDALNGVSAPSDDVAFAVGTRRSPRGVARTAVLMYRNGRWEPHASPNKGGPEMSNVLAAVSADSATDAWAVGTRFGGNAPGGRPLVLHWDGTRWRMVRSVHIHGAGLNGVAALSPTDVWVVGSRSQPSGRTIRPLIEHYDGTSWSLAPGVGGHSARLYGVAAGSPSDVWAVGPKRRRSLVANWDGSVWRQNVMSVRPELHAVTLEANGDPIVVGRIPVQDGSAIHYEPFASEWDGSAWTVQDTPTVGTDDDLAGVASDGTHVWAVGFGNRGHHYSGLIEYRC